VNPNLPKGQQTIYLVKEWFGGERTSRGALKGLMMPPTNVHHEIIAREEAARAANRMPLPWFGVADPSMWDNDGTESIASIVNGNKMLFRKASRERVGDKGNRVFRKTLYHQLLATNPETGKPKFQVFESCKQFRNAFPKLILDDKNPEDIDTDQDDHLYDATAYGLVELITNSCITVHPGRIQQWAKKSRHAPLPV